MCEFCENMYTYKTEDGNFLLYKTEVHNIGTIEVNHCPACGRKLDSCENLKEDNPFSTIAPAYLEENIKEMQDALDKGTKTIKELQGVISNLRSRCSENTLKEIGKGNYCAIRIRTIEEEKERRNSGNLTKSAKETADRENLIRTIKVCGVTISDRLERKPTVEYKGCVSEMKIIDGKEYIEKKILDLYLDDVNKEIESLIQENKKLKQEQLNKNSIQNNCLFCDDLIAPIEDVISKEKIEEILKSEPLENRGRVETASMTINVNEWNKMKESGNDMISHPSHYCDGRKYEPKDVIRDWGLNFNIGSAVKYLSRAGEKAIS